MTQEERAVLEPLKKGDTFYKVTRESIEKYEYLMLYPFHNPENVKIDGYHIVLSKNLDEPKRIYYTELATILLKGAKSYEDAKLLQIKLVEQHLVYLKQKVQP